MIRDLEKDLIEIECAIKSQEEKDNTFTVSVLERCYELVSELKGYKELKKKEKSQRQIGNWIPCSERMPDTEESVLLSLRNLDICVGFNANTEGRFYVVGDGYVEYENVLAWQPLPEPYKS